MFNFLGKIKLTISNDYVIELKRLIAEATTLQCIIDLNVYPHKAVKIIDFLNIFSFIVVLHRIIPNS